MSQKAYPHFAFAAAEFTMLHNAVPEWAVALSTISKLFIFYINIKYYDMAIFYYALNNYGLK